MVEIGGTKTVYLACGATDMRKDIDGLAGLVEQHFKLGPFSRAMFVFCSKDKSKIKILQWDKNGFWLYYKRLERGRFRWPQNADELKEISGREFRYRRTARFFSAFRDSFLSRKVSTDFVWLHAIVIEAMETGWRSRCWCLP